MIALAKTYGIASLVVGLALFTAGCQSVPSSPNATRIHTVHVGPKIEPLQINAGRGDEVRWVNQRSQPIALIFPKSDDVRISCRSGFRNMDSALSAVLPPNASASICFSELGKYDYQVRLDENLPGVETDRNASVFVVGGGARNPRPVEAFENVTP